MINNKKKSSTITSYLLWGLSLFIIIVNIFEFEVGNFLICILVAIFFSFFGILMYPGGLNFLQREKITKFLLIISTIVIVISLIFGIIYYWIDIWTFLGIFLVLLVSIFNTIYSYVIDHITGIGLNTVLLLIIIYLLIKNKEE